VVVVVEMDGLVELLISMVALEAVGIVLAQLMVLALLVKEIVVLLADLMAVAVAALV
jgi:hypothetical protein